MPNVRIKKAPRTGEQEDYALVYNNVATSEAKPKEGVKTTMTAVPREQANIEVEGNESVIGDINQDGFLELMTFQGKRHYEGGMPVNIPDGSFIFSDTSKLRITDPELLKYFGMGNNKKGYTPAQISKKYQINEYIDTLKNEDADDIAKKTANEMLKNNTKKLAELAVVQESMKGFENGIPDFAASVMAGLQGEQPQMKEGGWLPKYQKAGQKSRLVLEPVTTDGSQKESEEITKPITKPRKDRIYYFNGEKYQLDVYSKEGNYSKGIYVFKPLNPFYKEFNIEPIKIKDSDFKTYLNADKPYKQYLGTNVSNAKINNYLISTEPGKFYKDPTTIKFGKVELPTKSNTIPSTITDFTKIVSDKDGKLYYLANANIEEKPYMESELIAPHIVNDENLWYPPSRKSLKWESPIIKANSIEVSPIFDDYDNVIGYKPAKPYGKYNTIRPKTFTETDLYNNLEFLEAPPVNTSNQPTIEETVNANDQQKQLIVTPPVNTSNQSIKIINDPDIQSFKTGGELKKYVNGGDKKQESIDKYGYYKEIPENVSQGVYDLYFGNLRVRYKDDKAVAVELKDGTKYKINTNGTFSNINNLSDIKQFTQYDELPRLTSIATKRGVKFDPTQFTNVVNIQARQRGNIYGIEMTPDQWVDFGRRHGQFIEKVTGDKFEDWKAKVEKGDKGSVAKFQKAYNDYIGYEYFKKRDGHKDPYGVDDKLGWITFSAPALYNEVEQHETKKTSVVNERDPFTEDEVKSDEYFEEEKPLLDTWFAPDITNFVGAITDPINRYEPVQGKVNLVTPGYDLLDPTRQLAANQEQMARYQYMLENSVDPQIALSASLAASGEGFQNAANVLANVENANVGIVNQAYQQNAAIENQETTMNENARQKYIAEMAMLNENMDKAKSLKKWRVISAYNQGWHNFNKDQMMEQVLFPQVHTDNITGAVQFSGNGRALDEYNTYNNLYSMGNSQNPIPSTDALKSYYDDLIEKGFTSSFAEKFLLDQISADKKKNNRSIEQAYAEAQGLLSQQFGGAFNINDYIGI